MRKNDELRQKVVSLRSHLMSDSSRLRLEPEEILRESIRWSALISAAGYHQDRVEHSHWSDTARYCATIGWDHDVANTKTQLKTPKAPN